MGIMISLNICVLKSNIPRQGHTGGRIRYNRFIVEVLDCQ